MADGPTMMRILYLIDNLDTPQAGTERQLMQTLEILDRRRFECTLMTLTSSPWLLDARLPCAWVNLGAGPLLRPKTVGVVSRFIRLCRERRIQLLHTFFSDSNVVGPIMARLAGIPVVVGSRRNLGYLYRRKDLWAQRFANRFLTHIISNSDAAAQAVVSLEGFDPSRITVIPNMLDMNAFVPPAIPGGQVGERWGFPPDTTIIGAVANLRPIKNLDLLIRAATAIAPRYRGVRFVILGEGPERPRLQAAIDAAGMQQIFILPGLSTQVHRDIFTFDIGALVSDSESSPNALLEYMAAGRASVVSDVGGVREIVDHERHALVFPPGDLTELVRNLERLLQDARLRDDLGRNARERIQSGFSQAAVIRELEALYARLIGDPE